MIVITHARATPYVHLRHLMINSSCTKITVPTDCLTKKLQSCLKKEQKYYYAAGLLIAPHWAFFTQTCCSKQVPAQNNMQSQRVVSKTSVLSAIHSPRKFHFCHSMNCSMSVFITVSKNKKQQQQPKKEYKTLACWFSTTTTKIATTRKVTCVDL